MKKTARRVFVIAAVALGCLPLRPALGQNPSAIADEIAGNPILRHGIWGGVVLDCNTDEVIFEHEAERSLAPASNLKLVTSAAALAYLGSEFRFETKLGTTTQITGTRLEGDLCVIGGGDPTLATTFIPAADSWQLVIQHIISLVEQAGIREVSGNLIVDVSHFDPFPLPDGYPWVDIGNYYGAPVSALNFHDNLYILYFQPGKAVHQPATVLGTDPPNLGLSFDNQMTTGPVGSGDQGYIYGDPWSFFKQLRGSIPAGVRRFAIKGSLPRPPLVFGRLLKAQLAAHGIPVTGDVVVAKKPVAIRTHLDTLPSPPLREIVYWLNKKSLNLYAECLLKELGKQVKGEGSFAQGIQVLEDFFGKLNISSEGLHLLDGSGLSPQNRITPLQLGLLLSRMSRSAFFEDFYHSLPIAGMDNDPGRLGSFCRQKPAAGNVRAKTGLIERVRAHSGYVRTRSGRLLAFSFISNDYEGAPYQIDRLHERFLIALANLP